MKKLLLSLFMVVLAVPALAFEIPMPEGMKLNMYGQVRMNAVYDWSNTADGRTNYVLSDFKMNWQGNSRFGINFSAGNFFANVEMKVQPDQLGVTTGFRQFYGGYSFDNGLTIIAGNKTTIAGTKISNTWFYTDGGLAGFGAADDTRRPMIMVSYAGLDIALVANADKDDLGNVRHSHDIGDKFDIDFKQESGRIYPAETYIPRFEIAYNLKFSNFTGKIAAAYGLYTYDSADVSRINIHAWHVGATGKMNFGNMYAGLSAFYGQNAGMYGAVLQLNPYEYQKTSAILPSAAVHKPSTDPNKLPEVKVRDVTTWGATLAFGMKMNDFISFELGGGWQMSFADNYRDRNDATKKVPVNSYAAYIQAPINLMENYLILTPAVGYFGRMTEAEIGHATSVEELIAGAQVLLKF